MFQSIMCNHQSLVFFRKSDSAAADSSTDPGKKDSAAPGPIAVSSNPNQNPNPPMTKNIINYANDSLSIASCHTVVSAPPQAHSIPMPSPKTSSQSNNTKISLVPTKLLLKQQSVNSFKSTPTIVYSTVQTTSTPVTGTVTTNAQSSIPMKVVFVNAMNNNINAQQGGHKPQQITINNKSLAQLQQSHNTAFLNSAHKLLSTSQGQKVQIVQSAHLNSVPKVTTTVSNGDVGSGGGKANKLLGTKLPGWFPEKFLVLFKI